MTDPYDGYETMSAPNRYRKPFKDIDIGSDASHALHYLFAAGFGEDGAAIRTQALDMQKVDWPDKAGRALGMEPTLDLSDVILIWERSKT